MKIKALGLMLAAIISSTIFANNNAGFDDNFVNVEENEVMDSWITDLSSWGSIKSLISEVDREEELELESWMIDLDSEVWCSDQEEELVIEDWMKEIVDLCRETSELEEDLSLETWMLNPSEWLR